MKDYLIERYSAGRMQFCMNCMVCGSTWQSDPIKVDRHKDTALIHQEKSRAAQQAAAHMHCCPMCGNPVCKRCYQNIQGRKMCSKCAQKLMARLKDD
jgi:hypothetical protein